MNIALWIAQGLLAAQFLFAGGLKLVLPPEALAGAAPVPMPALFLRFIGICEMLGALGLILPIALKIRPGLTPLAAVGLVMIMIGATVTTLMGGQITPALIPFATGLVAVFVAYGRWPYVRSGNQTKLVKGTDDPGLGNEPLNQS
jgi:uncharacterized membrane protein YphA (DoxX/SURF4 family)